MGIGVSKQAAAQNHHHQLDHDSTTTKPVISPATTVNGNGGGRNSNASFISTGFGMGGFDYHHHVRQPSVRRRFQPMPPDRQELDQRFAKVLVSWTGDHLLGKCRPRKKQVFVVGGHYYDVIVRFSSVWDRAQFVGWPSLGGKLNLHRMFCKSSLYSIPAPLSRQSSPVGLCRSWVGNGHL